MTDTIEVTFAEVDELTDMIDNLNAEVARLEKENAALEDEYYALDKKLEDAAGEIRELEAVNNGLENDVEHYIAEASSTEQWYEDAMTDETNRIIELKNIVYEIVRLGANHPLIRGVIDTAAPDLEFDRQWLHGLVDRLAK